LVVALTNLDDTIRATVAYEPSNPSLPVKESRAIAGSQIKPALTVKAFGNVNHSGLEVQVVYTLPGESPSTQRLLVAGNSGHYVAEEFLESKQFGAASFKYTASQYVETVGTLTFEVSDQVSFGYGIEVVSHAVHTPTGKEVAVREPAPVGTDFTFQVTLFSSTENQKTSGDFEVVFNVVDASGVVIYSKVEDGAARSSDSPIEFTYTLDSPALPTGFLTFEFNVRGADKVVHTTDAVLYVYSSTMIASDIEFEGGDNEFSLGSSATIWMTPAVLPDLKTVHALPSTDYFGNDITSQRQFLLDATTTAGTSLGQVRSTVVDGRYQFVLPFEHDLDSLGTTVLSFKFFTSSQHTVALSNYDSASEEILDDAHAVNVTVTAQLQASDLEEPSAIGNLSYGNEVKLRFRLKDESTGRAVAKGKHSNVYLLLNHIDAEHDTSFVSSKQAATEANGEFSIVWHVDPNAIRGPGYLTVVAENADGVQVPVHGYDGAPLRYDVVIDGNIDIDFSSTSTDSPYLSAAAFLAQVKLSSNGRPLEGAKLSVEVVPSVGESFTAPVASGDDGVYTISWSAPHEKAYSGVYTLKFFREADRAQAAEIDSAAEKKYRKVAYCLVE
jgi:hypothetical protein